MWKFIRFIEKKFKEKLLILGLLGILSSCTSLLMNYSLKYAVDYAFQREGTYLIIAVIWFLTMAFSTFLSDQLGEGYLAAKYQILFVKKIREALVERYEKKSYLFTQKKELGDLLNTNELVEEIGELFLTMAYSLPYCIFESLGFVLFVGFFVSWKLDLVLLILIPFAYFFYVLTERMRAVNREIIGKQSSSRNFFIDTLSKLDFVKANGYGNKIDDVYRKKNAAIYASQKSLEGKKAGFSWLKFLVENGIKLVVPIYAVILYDKGEITPGGIVVSTAIFSGFLVPSVFQLIQMYKELRSAEPIVKKVLLVMEEDAEPVIYQRKDIGEALILLEDVSFAYETRDIFTKINLTVPAKGSIAIKGISGEGKSTLLKLIAGLYAPKSGKVIYNKKFFPEFIPDAVSYMSTNSFFVQDTVEKNIFLESDKSVLFVNSSRVNHFLEESMEIEVEENGKNFSGGQQKLIGFSRAVAKRNIALVILDEPTASLDEKIRDEVWKKIEELSKSICVIVSTHDEDLYRKMDARYVMKDGALKQGRPL